MFYIVVYVVYKLYIVVEVVGVVLEAVVGAVDFENGRVSGESHN